MFKGIIVNIFYNFDMSEITAKLLMKPTPSPQIIQKHMIMSDTF